MPTKSRPAKKAQKKAPKKAAAKKVTAKKTPAKKKVAKKSVANKAPSKKTPAPKKPRATKPAAPTAPTPAAVETPEVQPNLVRHIQQVKRSEITTGVSFTELDTSDGKTKRQIFNSQTTPNQVVLRYTVEVSKDLTDKSILLGFDLLITRISDGRVVVVNADSIKTAPADLGSYVISYDPIPAGSFAAQQIYKFQIFAVNLGDGILVPSPEWFFYVTNQ